MARYPGEVTSGVLISGDEAELSDEERLYTEFLDDARVNNAHPDLIICRIPIDPRTKKPRSSADGEFIGEMPMDSFKNFNAILSWLRDEYGGGFYRITGRRVDPNGSAKTHFNRTVTIATPVAKDSPVEGKAPGMNDFMSAIQAMTVAQQTQNENLLRGLAQIMRPAQPASDLSPEKIMQWVAAGAALLGQMKGLFAPAQTTPMTGLAGMISEFNQVQELLGRAGNATDTNESDVMNTLIKTFGPVIAALVMKGNAQAAAPASAPQLAAPIPSPAPAPRTAPAPAQPSNEMTDMNLTALNQLIDLGIEAAKKNVPPAAFAREIIDGDTLTDEQVDSLLDFCERSDAIDILIKFFPRVVPYQSWFDALRLAIRDYDQAAPGGDT